jgi:DNA modification methylase
MSLFPFAEARDLLGPCPLEPGQSSIATTMPVVKIGPHRLYLGDAYTIRPTLGWFDADVMDPPYAFDNSGGGKWRASRGAADRMIADGLTDGFDHSIINPNRCGQCVVFFHADQRHDLEGYLKQHFHRAILFHWQKDNPTPHHNRNLIADIEEFFIAWTEDGAQDYFFAWHWGKHPKGGEHHDFHRYVTGPVQPTKLYGHDTVKPDYVMDKIMRNVNGQTVCDPFMGTGSTGVAAIKASKTFTGIEHNPKHFETAVRRIGAAYEEKKNANS